MTNEGFSTAVLNVKLSLLEKKLSKANEEINELNDECKVLAKRVIERNATIREKDARIKELEADVKREAQSSTHNAQDCLDEQLRAEALEAKLAVAEKALESAANDFDALFCTPRFTETKSTYDQFDLVIEMAGRFGTDARKALAVMRGKKR